MIKDIWKNLCRFNNSDEYIEVYLHKDEYDYPTTQMIAWCKENCEGDYRAGWPETTPIVDPVTFINAGKELPWRFKNKADAVMFLLRWS